MVLVVGHRGCGVLADPNTAAACAKARELGLHACEIDLLAFPDGTIRLGHDTDHANPQELASLGDVCDVLRGGTTTGLICELKSAGATWAGNEAAFATLARDLEGIPHVVFSSFDMEALKAIAGVVPAARRAVLFNQGQEMTPPDWIDRVRQVDGHEAHFRFTQVTSGLVSAAHSAGLATLAWFPGTHDETAVELGTLVDAGVDMVCCNNPKAALACVPST